MKTWFEVWSRTLSHGLCGEASNHCSLESCSTHQTHQSPVWSCQRYRPLPLSPSSFMQYACCPKMGCLWYFPEILVPLGKQNFSGLPDSEWHAGGMAGSGSQNKNLHGEQFRNSASAGSSEKAWGGSSCESTAWEHFLDGLSHFPVPLNAWPRYTS